jgi:FAD synthetase
MPAQLITKSESLDLTASYKLAMVSGSFDILHPGHLYLFKSAKGIAPDAKLLVLILDDKNIKQRKGDERPIHQLNFRIKQIQDKSDVDYILPWIDPWEDIAKFVAILKPDYYVAVDGDPGLENKRKSIQAYGGKFILIKRLSGFSTSAILAKQKHPL